MNDKAPKSKDADPLQFLLQKLGKRKTPFSHQETLERFGLLREIEEMLPFDYSLEVVRQALVDDIVYGNILLVVKLARQYSYGRMSLIDCVEEGIIGLMTAIDRFDPARGTHFSTYASWWIRQAVQRACETNDTSTPFRIPTNAQEEQAHVVWGQRLFRERHGREPSPEELLETVREKGTKRSAKMTLAQVKQTLERLASRFVSLDAPMSVEKDDGTEHERIGSEPSTETLLDIRRELIRKTRIWHRILSDIQRLDDREKLIMQKRLVLQGDPKPTLEEIGRSLGCSRERVRQIEGNVLKHLTQKHDLSVRKIKQLPEDIEELKRLCTAY